MVNRNPSISKVGFSFDFIILIVLRSLLIPSNAKYSACTGIMTESAAVSALIVINPNEGEQSINI
ncbi:hypothetical protein SDC9_100766 [bioreactor metagenome]|uniref:Uncharacterized protein n=1 Tax=bioreactor metagenome TaxID=1076179 RepID=A0A645AWS6_9ZZZZ